MHHHLRGTLPLRATDGHLKKRWGGIEMQTLQTPGFHSLYRIERLITGLILLCVVLRFPVYHEFLQLRTLSPLPFS